MRILTVIALLAITTSTMAAAISYSDDFENATTYANDWATMSGVNRPARNTEQAGSPDNSLKLVAGGGPYGVENDLADGVEMPSGAYLEPTAGNPIVLSVWTFAGDRQNSCWEVFISYGSTKIGIANSFPAGGGNNDIHYYNGSSWFRAPCGTSWGANTVTLTLESNGNVTVTSPKGSKTYTNQYVAKFDNVSIEGLSGTTVDSWVDDISVSGGNVVPEPTMLALLGLGLPFVMKRRHRR